MLFISIGTVMTGVFVLAMWLLNMNRTMVSPKELIVEYMSHISDREYEKMYEMIDIDESGNISRNDFIKRNSAIYEGIKGVASSVGVIPGEMDNKNETIKKMARFLNIKQKDINKKLSAKWVKDDYFVPIKTIKKHSGKGYTSNSVIGRSGMEKIFALR